MKRKPNRKPEPKQKTKKSNKSVDVGTILLTGLMDLIVGLILLWIDQQL